ncbi:MAG: hypothetical protein LUF35_09820 [Lachnospiraceae bacterium]|nr:hypothetical protein [Lachnospiraceae bacterium]
MYDFVKADCYLSEGTDRAETEESFYKHVYTMTDAGIKFYSCEEPTFGHNFRTWKIVATYSVQNLLWK